MSLSKLLEVDLKLEKTRLFVNQPNYYGYIKTVDEARNKIYQPNWSTLASAFEEDRYCRFIALLETDLTRQDQTKQQWEFIIFIGEKGSPGYHLRVEGHSVVVRYRDGTLEYFPFYKTAWAAVIDRHCEEDGCERISFFCCKCRALKRKNEDIV